MDTLSISHTLFPLTQPLLILRMPNQHVVSITDDVTRLLLIWFLVILHAWMKRYLLLPPCQMASAVNIVAQPAFICDCKIRCPVLKPHSSASDVCCETHECSMTYRALYVLTGMLLNGLSIISLICVFILCS